MLIIARRWQLLAYEYDKCSKNKYSKILISKRKIPQICERSNQFLQLIASLCKICYFPLLHWWGEKIDLGCSFFFGVRNSRHFTALIQTAKMTCLSWMTWFASSCIGKGTPSSEAKEDIGDRVPLLRITFLAGLKSENACNNNLLFMRLLTEMDMSGSMTKPTKWPMRPAKTQISLGICKVWSESSLCAQWVAKDIRLLHADNNDSDQIADLNLHWVHRSVCWFCCEAAYTVNLLIFAAIIFAFRCWTVI